MNSHRDPDEPGTGLGIIITVVIMLICAVVIAPLMMKIM